MTNLSTIVSCEVNGRGSGQVNSVDGDISVAVAQVNSVDGDISVAVGQVNSVVGDNNSL
jgi:hypothetical protein